MKVAIAGAGKVGQYIAAAVSPPHLLTALVEEAVSVGDLVRLLRLEKGKVSLVEVTLSDRSYAVGKLIGELGMPQDCAVVAVVRNEHVIVPRDETPLIAGDELLCIAAAEAEAAIEELLSGRPQGKDGSSPDWPADRVPDLPKLSSDGV